MWGGSLLSGSGRAAQDSRRPGQGYIADGPEHNEDGPAHMHRYQTGFEGDRDGQAGVKKYVPAEVGEERGNDHAQDCCGDTVHVDASMSRAPD